jgi:DtxR family Mn-dependent transcriptional regulator
MSPASNLILFLAVLVVVVLLVAPRYGLIHLIRSRWRDLERIQLEDALKYLCDREGRGTTAGLSAMADALRVSSGRGVALVEKMQRAGLVTVLDGRILLSSQGRSYALEIIRAHRLWERYLADETGVDPVRWHALAERREHALTPVETDALARRLGNPRFDPHGDPIPTADGEMPQEPSVSLSQLGEGEMGRVVHVEDEPDAVFEQLVALGLYPGMEVRVTSRSAERIAFDSNGRGLDLSQIAAGNVFVVRISAAERQVLEEARETLVDLGQGETAVVARISPACRGLERRRLMDLGILPGTRVEYDRRGLTGGLTSYVVRGTRIALRDEQAQMITIHQKEQAAA